MTAFFNDNLGKRVSVTFTLILSIFGLLLGSFFAYKGWKVQMDSVRQEILKAASFFTQNASILLIQKDVGKEDIDNLLKTTRVVKQNVNQGLFKFAEIIDTSGNLVVPYEIGMDLSKPHFKGIKNGPWGTLALGQDYLFVEETFEDTGPVIEGIFGILNKNKILGYVVLGVSSKPIQNALFKNMISTLATVILFLLIALIVSWKMGHKLTEPLLELAEKIKKLDEIEDLSKVRVANATSEIVIVQDNIIQYAVKSREYDKKLNELVEAKTKELSKVNEELKVRDDFNASLMNSMSLNEFSINLLAVMGRHLYHNDGCLYILSNEENEPYFFPNEKMFMDRDYKDLRLVGYPRNSTKEINPIHQDMAVQTLKKNEIDLIENIQGSNLKDKFAPYVRSALLMPFYSGTRPIALLFLWMTGDATFQQNEIGHIRTNLKVLEILLGRVIDKVQLELRAIKDPMTNVFNRLGLKKEIDKEFTSAVRREANIAFLMCDLDKFKNVNDTYGHDVGDEVIKAFAEILKKQRRSREFVTRLGGEEFLIVMPDAKFEEAKMAAERILTAVRKLIVDIGNGKSIQITCTIGVSAFPDHDDNAEKLIVLADKALYVGKKGRQPDGTYDEEQSRDRYVAYEDWMFGVEAKK